ncbi:endonuclease/exonuclease/phosphatase family protein (macronuclear) [Tetrahymena thermophila SB210]|uniref:phosphoinositide 5-phosphatase n=1 Tax=Tetrahymena thermophila (strain SB210) TaxID=312017 RepID=Q22MH2_TETTS|nr:endonuclease/exonuclease/phosphatase family protein [Tetrahymena thermophila SB210]EAR86607.2 endonuclease/exonuclease/phosphatase family protein [Tetrahymena thermophila SB210]|eukprot:XP_977048.2 endonuclease/exonuclease/phosphatase family protein [Tetrahymena thermophila SB210]
MKNFAKQIVNSIQSMQFQSTNDKKFQPQLNTKLIKLYDFYEIYSLEADRSVTNINSNLYIFKASGKIKEGYENLKGTPEEYSGFLGIINVLGVNFLVLVKEVNVLFVLDGKDKIFEIVSVEFKEINENPEQSKSSKEVQSFLEKIEKILSSGGYYFSYKYPLTLSQQKISELQNQQKPQSSQQITSQSLQNQLFHLVDYDFMWNYNLMKPLIQQKVSLDWQAQLIQGHVYNIVSYLPNLAYYTLISRRSMKRGGTRYSHRGIDSDGNVANFVESEQILMLPQAECIVSHVQIRGSVPSFWSQKGLSAKVKIDFSKQLSNQACKLHLDYINKQYSEATCVNLMQASSTNESKLTREFVEQICEAPNRRDTIEYQEFDFHHEVKNEKFDNIDQFIKINTLSNLQRYGFFIRNTKGDVMKKQKGVVRTNCLDCLDRTNFFQLRIAFIALTQIIFQQLNLKFNSSTEQDKFQKDFQQCWGENGDNISMHYADTNATTSNVAKTGKQGVLGFLKGKFSSAKRFFKGNLTDAVKQQCYCIILGEHYETQENLGFQEEMQKELKQREEEFITKSNITIFACTWNLNAYLPEKTTHQLNPIFLHNQKQDIVIIAFQELVELKPQNLMMSTHQKHNSQNYWEQIILNNLGKGYFLVTAANLVGIQTYIFAKSEMNGRITNIQFDSVKCGFVGQLGNKGGVAIRFNVDDTSIAVLNCHLPAGQSKVSDRISSLQQCIQYSFQQEGMATYKKEPITKSDKLILMGDLNFRIDKKYADCISVINKVLDFRKDFKLKEAQSLIDEQLLNYDQIYSLRKLQGRPISVSSLSGSGQQQGQGSIEMQQQGIPKSNTFSAGDGQNSLDKAAVFKFLYEKRIHFLPTYKFDSGTNIYDTSKKQRVPSYCDRIFIWDIENDNINIENQFLLYESCNIDNSDHKPVCAVLQFQVKQINKDIREQIIAEILSLQLETNKDVEALRNTNKPQSESDLDLNSILSKNENNNKISNNNNNNNNNNYNFSEQELANIQYIKKHQNNDLINFTTQTTACTFNSNNNNNINNNNKIQGDKVHQGTVYTSKTTSYQNKNNQNTTVLSNNYNDSGTVWNFDFNNFNQSNQPEQTRQTNNQQSQFAHMKKNNHVDLLDDNFFDTPPNPNLQDELREIKLLQDVSAASYGQQFNFGSKQVSQENTDFYSQTPNLLTLESDKPNQPYASNLLHYNRNSLQQYQQNQVFQNNHMNQQQHQNQQNNVYNPQLNYYLQQNQNQMQYGFTQQNQTNYQQK